MTPVERLNAAIEKLQTLKAESTPAPWAATRHGVETVPERDPHRFDIMSETIAHTELLHADTELIVSLHRTIDPLIVILMGEVDRVVRLNHPRTEPHSHALALADAILGGAS